MQVPIQCDYKPEGVQARTLGTLARLVIAEVLRSCEVPDNKEISLLFVDDNQMRELNRMYRNLDRTTDVLAFSMREGPEMALPPEACDANELLGDIVISLETAQLQAKTQGHSLRREVSFLLIHGTLHLLGYDHHSGGKQSGAETRKMRKAEKECLAELEKKFIV